MSKTIVATFLRFSDDISIEDDLSLSLPHFSNFFVKILISLLTADLFKKIYKKENSTNL